MLCNFFFFFFQAEDGIRDYKVTGVQTCALPILTGAVDETLPVTGPFNLVAGDAVNQSGLNTWFYGLDGELLRAGYDIVYLSAEWRYATQKEGTGQIRAIAVHECPNITQNDVIFT